MRMDYNYAGSWDSATMARAVGLDLPLSWKTATMVLAQLRGQTLESARALLGAVTAKKAAIPFTRYNFDRGHKVGMGPGRYPIKAAAEIMAVLEAAAANAEAKGLTELRVAAAIVHKGTKRWKAGRRPRRGAKSAHIEIVLAGRAAEAKEGRK